MFTIEKDYNARLGPTVGVLIPTQARRLELDN